ncbi:DUF1016 family protein [Candidatus Poribacteria bacterium]|nr:DUF1016 family protein [Candidatus Poribacteria bacterium]
MDIDLSVLNISTTKPDGKPAKKLAELGINIVPIEEDEGNVDRYIISQRLAIERRTGSGFLRGIMDKTLFTSAIYLREHFHIPVLIVEGEINYEYTMFDPQAVRGALSSMMIQYGINVLSTANLEDTISLITMMTRHEQVGIPEISLVPKRKATDLPDMQRRIIEMLPGCGRIMARDLLQHFGNVRDIINANEDDLLCMRGIGKKKASEIHHVLNAEYEAVDTEKNLEDAIEESYDLLFKQPVELVDRQHHIFTEEKDKHIVDMVFFDPESEELILVELKRGKLNREHYNQLRRYLDNAPKSKILYSFLERGIPIRGILATVEDCKFKPDTNDVSVCIIDKNRVIRVLKQIRKKRLELINQKES